MEHIEIPRLNLNRTRDAYYIMHRFWRVKVPKGNPFSRKNNKILDVLSRQIRKEYADQADLFGYKVIMYSRYIFTRIQVDITPLPGDPHRAVWLSRCVRDHIECQKELKSRYRATQEMRNKMKGGH